MAEVQAKDNGGKEKGKQKKMTIRVDFTPMVDMNMLLITFFMLCTSLSKPQTMEISMPSNDKVTEEEQNKVQASRAITVILGGDNQLFYILANRTTRTTTPSRRPHTRRTGCVNCCSTATARWSPR